MTKLHTVDSNGARPPTPDAADIEALWLDPALGDGIVNVNFHTVPVGRPRDFFRTHPNNEYRRRTELYIHKPEGVMDEQHYIIGPTMQGRIAEARPVTLVCCMYRDGTPRLWPVKHPKGSEKDNEAWVTARSAARIGIDRWVKLVWEGRAFMTREALSGYAPEPDFSKLPPYNELVKLAFGEHGVIRDTSHPVYRELFGMPPTETASADDVPLGDI